MARPSKKNKSSSTPKRQTKRVIEKMKKKEAKCPSCKSRKHAHKKMMNTRKKKTTVKAIRQYWKKFLQCETCMKRA